MKATKTITTTTYETDIPGFLIDVTEEDKGTDWHMFEAWIYHKDYGTKLLMFGAQTNTKETFLSLVECNVQKHTSYYRDEIMDE